MFSGAVQNPDIKSLWPNILLWSKRADLSISMSYLLRVPGAEKKRKKKGICKTWMPIFFLVVMQFLRMRWWILLIWQLSFGVIEREKGKDYIILSRIAPCDKYLHLPCSACLFCCDSLIALVSHSPTTVAHLSPLSEPVEFALLSGVRDGDEGLEPLLVSAPFPLSLFSLFPLPQSSSFFFCIAVYCFCLPKSFPHTSSSNISPSASSVCLQTLVLSVNRRRTVLYCPRWAH